MKVGSASGTEALPTSKVKRSNNWKTESSETTILFAAFP